jgi:hypothetical protein
MKKGFILLCFVVTSTTMYAKGNFEFSAGVPMAFESVNGTDTNMTSFAAGLSGIAQITETIGIAVYDNFVFPQKLKTTTGGVVVAVKGSDYDFIFGVDILLGPSFMLYQSNKLRFPLAVGVHGLMLTATNPGISILGLSFGMGVNITAEYRITPKVYLFGRIQGTYDFYANTTTTTSIQYGGYTYEKTSRDSGVTSNFTIMPAIGIGFNR